jgi:hypothetical protein
MKILILAMARTGSSSLQKRIAEEYKLKIIYEPKYDVTQDLDKQIEDNSVVKTILWHIPLTISNEMQWWIDLASRFDKVILLTRRNLKECAESIAYFRYYKAQSGFTSKMKYIWKPSPNYVEVEMMVNDYYNKLLELSKRINVELTYYEDVFDINSTDRLRNTNEDTIITKKINSLI